MVTPIKINALKSTIATQLKAAPGVGVSLKDRPEELLELLDRFWKAVARLVPSHRAVVARKAPRAVMTPWRSPATVRSSACN